jgi:hypothetical protein
LFRFHPQRFLQPHQHDIFADFHNVSPGNNVIVAGGEKAKKFAWPGYDDRFDAAVTQVDFQIGYLPKAFSIQYVDNLFGLKVGDLHHFSSPAPSSVTLVYEEAGEYVRLKRQLLEKWLRDSLADICMASNAFPIGKGIT